MQCFYIVPFDDMIVLCSVL